VDSADTLGKTRPHLPRSTVASSARSGWERSWPLASTAPGWAAAAGAHASLSDALPPEQASLSETRW